MRFYHVFLTQNSMLSYPSLNRPNKLWPSLNFTYYIWEASIITLSLRQISVNHDIIFLRRETFALLSGSSIMSRWHLWDNFSAAAGVTNFSPEQLTSFSDFLALRIRVLHSFIFYHRMIFMAHIPCITSAWIMYDCRVSW